MTSTVHVVGAGPSGLTLASLLADFGADLGLTEVTLHKRSAAESDRPALRALLERGVLLAAEGPTRTALEGMGVEVAFSPADALTRATVVVDTTGAAVANKDAQYSALTGTRGFVAVGGDLSFGAPFIHGISEDALRRGTDRFLAIPDVGTHVVALLCHALARKPDGSMGLEDSRFLLMEPAAELGTASDFIASPVIQRHPDPQFGTHHARDASLVLGGNTALPVFSSSVELHTQLLSTVHFQLRLADPMGKSELLSRLREEPRVALTEKLSANPVVSFARDNGYAGRLLNSLVVPHAALCVHGSRNVNLAGFAFAGRTGTQLYSALCAVLWLMEPEGMARRLDALKPYIFAEV
ncbi:MAG: hypothetical protein AB2A00_38890 [Myxococcota bacterium]